MKIAIFSDLHLSNDPQSTAYASFLGLLEKLAQDKELSELWLMGDIFDLFVGPYRFWKKRHHKFFDAIAKLRGKGIKILWAEGNHDFFLEDLFKPDEILWIKENIVHEVAGKKVYLAHGDLIDQEDQNYQKWRSITRSTPFRLGLRVIPEALAEKLFLPVAQMSSKKSRKRGVSRGHPEQMRQSFAEFAQNLIETDSGVDAVVLGHSHFQTLAFWEGKGWYLNLGAWAPNKGHFALWDPEKDKKPSIQEISF